MAEWMTGDAKASYSGEFTSSKAEEKKFQARNLIEESERQRRLIENDRNRRQADLDRITKRQKTYEGTVLDALNPNTIVERVDSLLKMFGQEVPPWEERGEFDSHFNPQERDALRHYIGTQAISSKFGPSMAGLIGKLNEYPYDSTNVQKKVDIANNRKAIEDFKSGNMLNPNWMKMTKYADAPIAASTLDSLLQHLIIPPPGGDYGPDTTY